VVSLVSAAVFASSRTCLSLTTLCYCVQVLELLYEPLQHPQLKALYGCKHVTNFAS
jgi:uncharacterized membrane protein YhfC